ncbi:hypothetical protein F2P81_026348 [Scophthalmus maximus]|uniref:Uncharacterized protein n=1 Tax=Scophthalmus maximus TaxID=52904 RepID=A0A6A4RM91_SCOMX|nr:hypothetical protein F2P81_026348 [Scophthalmus maximus]
MKTPLPHFHYFDFIRPKGESAAVGLFQQSLGIYSELAPNYLAACQRSCRFVEAHHFNFAEVCVSQFNDQQANKATWASALTATN